MLLLSSSPVVGVFLPADGLVAGGVHVAGPVHHLAQARLHHDHLSRLIAASANNIPGTYLLREAQQILIFWDKRPTWNEKTSNSFFKI